MKILHAGNMANLGYTITRQLRKNGIEADLLMQKNPPKGSDPIRFDPEIHNEYPEWIEFFDKSKWSWKINVIKKMRDKKYDLIHAYVEFPIFAYFSSKTIVSNTQGSDFRELAFTNSLRGILLRRAYKKSKAILFFQPDHLPLFSKLKLKNGIFLPPLWDTSFFKPNEVNREEFGDKFLIFHPANLEWRLKGNDVLIKGYAEFVKNNSKALLIIVDRGIDSKKTHELVNNLGIENNVRFVEGPLNSSELLRFYNLSDVIADQFKLGALGSIGWETFSCAKPLIAFINEKQYKEVYGEVPPIANASTVTLINKQLENLSDFNLRKKLGIAARNWIIKYHSPNNFSKKLVKLYQSILDDEPIEQIRLNISTNVEN